MEILYGLKPTLQPRDPGKYSTLWDALRNAGPNEWLALRLADLSGKTPTVIKTNLWQAGKKSKIRIETVIEKDLLYVREKRVSAPPPALAKPTPQAVPAPAAPLVAPTPVAAPQAAPTPKPAMQTMAERSAAARAGRVAEAEALAAANGGVLPPMKEIRRINFSLHESLRQRSAWYAHIPRSAESPAPAPTKPKSELPKNFEQLWKTKPVDPAIEADRKMGEQIERALDELATQCEPGETTELDLGPRSEKWSVYAREIRSAARARKLVIEVDRTNRECVLQLVELPETK